MKGGFAHGLTHDYGYEAVDDKVHVHDLHATILHLLGLDHERLTYSYAGRDFRLTDVKGSVVKEIMAETEAPFTSEHILTLIHPILGHPK